MSAEETSSSNRWRLAGVAAIILVGLLGASVAFQPRYRHADLVAIKSVHTGKYLALDSDGLLRASASSSSEASARFRLLRLDANVVKAISKSKPPKTHLAVAGKLGCACSGASDEHGFGRFCHNWESEWHQPWCYVDASCKHGVRSKRHSSRHLQVCKEEEGYLGPDGWLPEPGCHCTGMESIHGFGAYCKGWEFPGQTPWCYVNEECGGALGTTGARFMDCVANDSVEVSPPPPPPLRLVESHDGWGTPQGCPCSGWSNKHGYGAYCKGWELDGQIPWCYVMSNCTAPTTGGSFTHRFIECYEMPKSAKREADRQLAEFHSQAHVDNRLLQETATRKTASTEAARPSQAKPVGKSAGKSKGDGKGPVQQTTHAPGRPVSDKPGSLKTGLLPGVKANATTRARLPKKIHLIRPRKHEMTWAAKREALKSRALRMPRFALQSQLSGGFVNIDPPPHKTALFAHSTGDSAQEPLSLSSVLALPASGTGSIFAFGPGAALSLCETSSDKPWAACTATPVLLRAPKATHPSKASEHHRKLLVSPETAPAAQFVVEILERSR